MSEQSATKQIVRIPVRLKDGKIEIVELENPSEASIRAVLAFSLEPANPEVPSSRLSQASASGTIRRARSRGGRGGPRVPHWREIRDWILAKAGPGDFRHTTAQIHEEFIGRGLSFDQTDLAQVRLARAVGSSHRRARKEIARAERGQWVGRPDGVRNQGATTIWTFIREGPGRVANLPENR
ncbi:MAG: hypothetical protein L3K18_08695 [Thermoplasmata archaeon]|nr:hypothetical protein [Thermoplasmata archaeon]